jgi:hypothetical protein
MLAASGNFRMHCLANPKVRLGLIVNGLYLLSLVFMPAPPQTRARLYARAYERSAAHLRSKAAPDYAPLSEQMLTTPLKAETHYWKESDQLDVFLTRELPLVRRRGHTLLLSPTYGARVLNPVRPRSVLMYFSSFSHEQLFDNDSPFVITADGVEVWRYGTTGPGDETPWNARAYYSSALDANYQVAETISHEIPYDVFVKVARARRVILELGPDTVELTPEQLEALRGMHRALPQ